MTKGINMIWVSKKTNEPQLDSSKERERDQRNKIRNEQDITTDTTEIQSIIWTTMNKYMPTNWKI